MSDLFAKEIGLGKFETFIEYMKITASKQNNMTTIFQERHQNKGKPYIFTHDSKFINLFHI